jgi:hypothetical protein
MRPAQHLSFFASAATFLLTVPAVANDSTAALGTGGLVFVTTSDIRMRSEDLYISLDEVRVRYEFENVSDRDVRTLVAFPMPDLKGSIDFMDSVPDEDPENFLAFETSVDGKTVETKVEQRVSALGVDQTQKLRALNVPLAPQLAETRAALDRLPQPEWDILIGLGLVAPEEYDAGQGMERHLAPMWMLSTTFYWEQTFAAGKTTIVEHRYKPSVGQTAGVSFGYEGARHEEWFKQYRQRYCIDDDFLAAFDRGEEKAPGTYFESRIEYILQTAANWAGTIENFRLTIDKGDPKNLVSFCGEDVKKTGATTFEMAKTDFYPDRDLSILILTAGPRE